MPTGTGDPFEAELEHLHRLDGAHRAESFGGMSADPAVQFVNLDIGQSRIRLRDRHECVAIPDAERVIGEQAGSAAAARLSVNQYRIDGVWLDLPFPPVAAATARVIRRGPSLEHQPFDAALARALPECSKFFPCAIE